MKWDKDPQEQPAFKSPANSLSRGLAGGNSVGRDCISFLSASVEQPGVDVRRSHKEMKKKIDSKPP